jgi:AmmeMemoRadiSam system protein A
LTADTDRQTLLAIARGAIVAHVTGAPDPAVLLTGVAGRPGGAFVTIHHGGELRGCIGQTEADTPVGAIIAHCAVAACSADPRFLPVVRHELDALALELSLLGPFAPIVSAEEVEVGRHGLAIESGWHRGLLLPQVATEWGWDRDTFLAQACRKAGLPKDAWKRGATIRVFEAEVFGEHEKPLHHRGH